MNTPNKLTVLRMILVPFFLVAMTVAFPHNYLVARIDAVMRKLETGTMEFLDLLNEPAA